MNYVRKQGRLKTNGQKVVQKIFYAVAKNLF